MLEFMNALRFPHNSSDVRLSWKGMLHQADSGSGSPDTGWFRQFTCQQKNIQYRFISGRIEDSRYTIYCTGVFPVCKMSKICHKSLTPTTVTTLLVLSTSFHHGGRKLKSFYGLEGFFFCDSYQESGKCVCTFVVIDRLVSDVVNHLQHTLFRLRLLIILLLRTAILCATAEESKSPPQPSRCLLWATQKRAYLLLLSEMLIHLSKGKSGTHLHILSNVLASDQCCSAKACKDLECLKGGVL